MITKIIFQINKKIIYEIAAVKKNKGKIFYTNEKQMSSTKIINQSGLSLDNKQIEFLNKIKKDDYYSIINALNKLITNKVWL